jgi:hypothetical protein
VSVLFCQIHLTEGKGTGTVRVMCVCALSDTLTGRARHEIQEVDQEEKVECSELCVCAVSCTVERSSVM